MKLYLDSSVLVALLLPDALNARGDRLLRGAVGSIIVSDFACAELASAVSRRVRMKELTTDRAMFHLAEFDAWHARSATAVSIQPDDVEAASSFLRRLDLTLRTPDAVHVAIARRLGVALATFDSRMAEDARRLGVPTVVS